MPSRKIEDLQPLLQVKARFWLQLCDQEWPDGDSTSGTVRCTVTDSSSPTPLTATVDLPWSYTNNFSSEP